MAEKPRRKAQSANGQRPRTTRVRSKKAPETNGAVEREASAAEPETVAAQVADPEAAVQPAWPEILVAQAAEPEVVAAEPVAVEAASSQRAVVHEAPIIVAAAAEQASAQTVLEPGTGPELVKVPAAHHVQPRTISIWAFSGQFAWTQLARSGVRALLLYGALAQNALAWQSAALRSIANGRR